MIRRDYILRMIEEFIQALSRIRALKKEQLWPEAAAILDEEFQRLIGGGARAVAGLSQTELIARLIRGEPYPARGPSGVIFAPLCVNFTPVSATPSQQSDKMPAKRAVSILAPIKLVPD